jgi:hypothetical protein
VSALKGESACRDAIDEGLAILTGEQIAKHDRALLTSTGMHDIVCKWFVVHSITTVAEEKYCTSARLALQQTNNGPGLGNGGAVGFLQLAHKFSQIVPAGERHCIDRRYSVHKHSSCTPTARFAPRSE